MRENLWGCLPRPGGNGGLCPGKQASDLDSMIKEIQMQKQKEKKKEEGHDKDIYIIWEHKV